LGYESLHVALSYQNNKIAQLNKILTPHNYDIGVEQELPIFRQGLETHLGVLTYLENKIAPINKYLKTPINLPL
jgi:hypothetical protein